jgi:hypothetical protein
VCGKQKINFKPGQNSKLVVVAFEPIGMPTMCFWENFEVFSSFMNVKKVKEELFFLAPTQWAWDNFYRIISGRGIIFTAYTVSGE